MATEERASNNLAGFEASDAGAGESRPAGSPARKAYATPRLRHLGSVRQLTLGNTGQIADGTSGRLRTKPSAREFKEDIVYLESADRTALAQDMLALPLASYRYKPGIDPSVPVDFRNLGFIIEDASPKAPFVIREQKEVDLYGFASAILVTLQEQQKTIARLEREVMELRAGASSASSASSAVPRDPSDA